MEDHPHSPSSLIIKACHSMAIQVLATKVQHLAVQFSQQAPPWMTLWASPTTLLATTGRAKTEAVSITTAITRNITWMGVQGQMVTLSRKRQVPSISRSPSLAIRLLSIETLTASETSMVAKATTISLRRSIRQSAEGQMNVSNHLVAKKLSLITKARITTGCTQTLAPKRTEVRTRLTKYLPTLIASSLVTRRPNRKVCLRQKAPKVPGTRILLRAAQTKGIAMGTEMSTTMIVMFRNRILMILSTPVSPKFRWARPVTIPMQLLVPPTKWSGRLLQETRTSRPQTSTTIITSRQCRYSPR